ncbi:MFS transporter [Bacillus massiliglaciei]|uniref:MFS transporter n=1 Tax=Bacillus massiliglaciei TaxID=1816693 RepID=UPI000AC6B250|nr:aromatic acid/H+ symport family MFS transporter [Bacillus massiliglaciei]
MKKINALEVVAASKFNRFHLFIFLWCFYAIGFDGYEIVMFGVGLPWMMDEWSLTSIQVGAMGSYSLIGMMLGALIFGPLADKLGRKNILAICMILFSLFTLGAGLAPNPIFFTVMRFISGLGMGGLMPNVISLMTEYSPKRNRAIIVATMYCGYSLGGVVASLVGMYIIPSTDWRVLYWIGILPLLTLPFFMMKFPESLSYYLSRGQIDNITDVLKKVDPDGNFSKTDDYQIEEMKESSKGFPVKKLFTNKRTVSTLAIWLAVFSCLLMVYGLNTWLPKMMQQSGYGLTSSLSFNMTLCIGQIFGSVIGGYYAEKIGHRRVLVILFGIGIFCFAGLSLTSNVILLYLLILIGGACTVGTMNLANPYISEYYPREVRATGMGWALGIGRIGAILAPTLFAMVLATGIDSQTAFVFFAIPSLIAALALLLIQEKHASFDTVEDVSLEEDSVLHSIQKEVIK